MKPPSKTSPASGHKRAKKLYSIKSLKDRADRALQDFYRAENPGKPCESCGRTFEVMHHYVEKSQSTGLRFEALNLIFLCHSCHFRHHKTGDAMVIGEVIRKRGMKWLTRIQKLKHERQWLMDRPFLMKQLSIYKSKLAQIE